MRLGLVKAAGCAAALWAAGSMAPASAQMFSGTIDNFTSNQFTQLQMQNIRRGAAYGDDGLGYDDDADFAAEFAGARTAADLELSFRPDRKLRRRMVAKLRDQVAEASPDDADVIGSDVFRLFEGALEPYGMSVNDLADSTTVYLSEVWDAANGVETDPSREAASAMRAQFADAYAAIAPSEPRLFDRAAVQEQSDAFLLQAYVIASLNKTLAQPNASPADRKAFQDAMRTLGREAFGIDLTRATIDERGLTPGEAIGALNDAVRKSREARAAENPEAEARRAVDLALGTPCGLTPEDALEGKAIRVFESRDACDRYEQDRYAEFKAEVPEGQRYAINYLSWYAGRPLYPADQAKIMDGMIE